MSPTPRGVIAVAVILPTSATFAVIARLYARRAKKAGIKSDDWTILLALVCVQNRADRFCTFLTLSHFEGSRLGTRHLTACW